MDTSLLLSYAGELSGLLVSGALLLTASAAIKASRKRNREEDDDDDENDENNNGKAKQSGDLSDGEEDSISAEWRQLHKLLKEKLQIDLVHKASAVEDDKYVRLNFSSKLPPSPKADDESRLIKALAEAGIKVLGSEDAGILCVSKSDLGFLSSEEVVRRMAEATTTFAFAAAAAVAAAAAATAQNNGNERESIDEGQSTVDDEDEESVVSSSGRRSSRQSASSRAVRSAVKRRKISAE
jgi:ribosomal protein L12E/L44/L45/RPP1/RPP2